MTMMVMMMIILVGMIMMINEKIIISNKDNDNDDKHNVHNGNNNLKQESTFPFLFSKQNCPFTETKNLFTCSSPGWRAELDQILQSRLWTPKFQANVMFSPF